MKVHIEAARWLSERMDDLGPMCPERLQGLWNELWGVALDQVRESNDRRLMNFLLDTDKPVPAECARELLTLRGPNRRPSAILETPEEVVSLVRLAIIRGHRFDNREKAENNPAFVAVARHLDCTPAAVQHHYRRCPDEKRQAIKDHYETARYYRAVSREAKRLLKVFDSDPAPEVELATHRALQIVFSEANGAESPGRLKKLQKRSGTAVTNPPAPHFDTFDTALGTRFQKSPATERVLLMLLEGGGK